MADFARMFSSGILSFGIYFALLIFFASRYYESIFQPKQYSFSKETVFEVAISEPEPKIEPPIEIPQQKEQPKEDVVEIKESASKTPKESVPLKELFSEVDVPKPTPPEQKVHTVDDELAKRLKALESMEKTKKSDSAKKLVEGLNIQKSVTFAPTQGEFDEYYAKIHEILMKRYAPSSSDRGEAKVLISIDKNGRFDYRIRQKSGNMNFDSYLESYLEALKNIDFPPFTKGNKTEIEVTFKTER